MRLSYSLKQSDPTNIVPSLVNHLEDMYDPQTAQVFAPVLGQINELRNKAVTIQIGYGCTDQEIDKLTQLLSTYVRYALVLLNRFNWNSERGRVVNGLQLTWYDSFQPKLEFKKHLIVFDVFCCYYNLAVLYMTRALQYCASDNDNLKKQGILRAKNAAYLLREMKEKYYGEFVNSGFHDTQFPHLDILESINLGLVYKCLYNSLKANEFKVGINKVAAICGAAARHFYKAYSVAQSFFMNPSGISDKAKTQILALTYIESLYFDVMTNARYAKHYGTMIDRDPSLISLVIAYEKKAMRLLEIGLKNPSVEALLNQNMRQKHQLVQIQQQLRDSLAVMTRNAMMMKARNIQESELPADEDLPQEYVAKLVMPQNLILENEGDFAKLMSEEAYLIGQELTDYSDSKKATIELSRNRLEDEIEKVYNEQFVNFYLQLDDGPEKTIPQALQEKLLEIRKLGGKNKLNKNINAMNQNAKNVDRCFKQLKQLLAAQEQTDTQKRKQYGERWTLQPSSETNKDYVIHLQDLQSKRLQAATVDQRIMLKCQKNVTFIQTLNAGDEAILKMLPKPELRKFVQQNRSELKKLHQKSAQLRKHRDYIEDLAEQVFEVMSKIHYPFVANNFLMKKMSKQAIFKAVFQQADELIAKFNQEVKSIKDEVQAVALISHSLNSKNREQHQGKKEFEIIVNCYNEIAQIYADCMQALGFYDKLNEHIEKLTADVEDYLYARKQATQELETSLNKKGPPALSFSANLPEMYPGKKKQPLPHFSPPPIPPSLYGQAQNIWGPQQQGANHFQPQGPQFPTNPFQGDIYPTKMVPSQQPQQSHTPQGPQGPQGLQGPQGPQGPPQPGQGNYHQQQQLGGKGPQHLQAPVANMPPNQQMGNPHLMPPQQPYGMMIPPNTQASIPPQVNFNSDPFVGRVFPSTHIRR